VTWSAKRGILVAREWCPVINARPGFWDIDRCSWVGVEPSYVVPPLRHADHPPERVAAGREPRVPAARDRRAESTQVETRR
jgi:hypothetical protein